MDKITIKGLKIFGYHGVNEEEKEEGQNFVFDVVLHVDRKKFKFNDLLDTTVNYAKVVKVIKRVVTENKFNLIETLAEAIAKEIICNFEDVQAIEVEVKKPEAPMKAEFEYVSAMIMRNRGDYIV